MPPLRPNARARFRAGWWPRHVAFAGLLAASLLGGSAHARTWTLAPGDPWPDLHAGDEVRLAAGRYDGPWEIAAPGVVVRADGAVLEGPEEGSALLLSAPDVEVRGLAVRGGGREADLYAPDAAAWLVGCDRCTLDRFTSEGTPAGLRIEASKGVTVRSARLEGAPDGPGITAYQAPELRIADVEVQGFLDGVYVERSDAATVTDVDVSGSARYGLHVMFSAGVRIEGARVRHGGVGSAVMYGRDARILGSRFEGHEGPLAYGLLLHEMHGVEVRDVDLLGNTLGAMIVSSPGVRIEETTFARSGTGLLVRRAPERESSAVVVAASRFLGNVGDVAVDDPDASVALEGNAYDAASRLDLDGDGRSDAPYLPTSTFALLATRIPDLSLFAFQPGITAWERAEGSVPALRLATLHDGEARPLSRERGASSSSGRLFASMLLLLTAGVGVAAWRGAPPASAVRRAA